MAKKKPKDYNVALAAEFYALSMLHRVGLDANLTLANHKAVDIVVVRGQGDAYTVDVKGMFGSGDWLVRNVHPKDRHFVVLVAFLGKIEEPTALPEMYVVPSVELFRENCPLVYTYPKGWKAVKLKTMRNHGPQFRDAWRLLA